MKIRILTSRRARVLTPVLASVAVVLLAIGGMARAQVQVPDQPPSRPTSTAEQIALGRDLTFRNCGMCHAVGVRGDSPNPQAPPFRRLHERMDVESLGEGLATGILTQHPAMPEFRFSPHEVIGIIRYLRSIQDQQPS